MDRTCKEHVGAVELAEPRGEHKVAEDRTEEAAAPEQVRHNREHRVTRERAVENDPTAADGDDARGAQRERDHQRALGAEQTVGDERVRASEFRNGEQVVIADAFRVAHEHLPRKHDLVSLLDGEAGRHVARAQDVDCEVRDDRRRVAQRVEQVVHVRRAPPRRVARERHEQQHVPNQTHGVQTPVHVRERRLKPARPEREQVPRVIRGQHAVHAVAVARTNRRVAVLAHLKHF